MKKSWNREEIIYEEVFDSYSMDLNTFKAQLNARLLEFNDNEEGYTYYIASDARNYYQATDAAKLQGCESVTISVTCSDGATLGQGTTQYKCRKCGKSLNAHSKECAMQTTVTENELDLSELDAMLQEAENQVAALQSQINALENENADLLKKIAEASVEDAAVYRQQYNANKTQIDRLKSELSEWQKKQREYTDAKAEAAGDNDVATDDYYRIPAIMQDCKTAYSLSWQDGGAWNGYTYVRKATMPNINGVITFKATVSIARKPKYFLRYQDTPCHRADQLGTDHGIYRHVCSRRADTRPEPVGRGENETGERPYCGDCTGTPFVQDHDGIRPYPAIGRDSDRGGVPSAVVERPARNRTGSGFPDYKNICRPRVAGKDDAL